MSKAPPPKKSIVPLVVVATAFIIAFVLSLTISDVRVLCCLAAFAVGAGVGCQYLFPAGEETGGRRPANESVSRSIAESRNEVINAMSILQQEIRLLQSSGGSAADKKALKDDVAQLTTEVAALKLMVQGQRK